MNADWRDVPVAALVVILLLREIIPLMRHKKGENGNSGERPVEYWEKIFNRHNDLLIDIQKRQERIYEMLAKRGRNSS